MIIVFSHYVKTSNGPLCNVIYSPLWDRIALLGPLEPYEWRWSSYATIEWQHVFVPLQKAQFEPLRISM